ncbi:MAG: hypothetical protein U5J78_01345 [Parasphingorhabdus sp.]|nr:hypothetical protein [Parasphingorhabdus sp.]
MTDPDTEPPIDPAKAAEARRTYLGISTIRLLGVAVFVLGLFIALGRSSLPLWTGYILLAVGAVQMWLLPFWLIRRYVRGQAKDDQSSV